MTQSEGPAPTGEDAARAAVRARMIHMRMSQRELATRSGVDKNTVGYYLSGSTGRPYPKTVAAIEDALEWPRGTIEAIARGKDATQFVIRSDETEQVVSESGRFVFSLPPGWDEGMTPAKRAATLKRIEAAALDVIDAAQRNG